MGIRTLVSSLWEMSVTGCKDPMCIIDWSEVMMKNILWERIIGRCSSRINLVRVSGMNE